MALTFTNNSSLAAAAIAGERGLRSWKQQGLVEAVVDMITSLGSNNTADYPTATGFDLAGNAAKMGFRKIFHVFGVYVRTSANAKNVLEPWWDPVTGKLRFFIAVTGTGATEVTTEIAAASIIRFVVIGV